jgi:hypothetical protein
VKIQDIDFKYIADLSGEALSYNLHAKAEVDQGKQLFIKYVRKKITC